MIPGEGIAQNNCSCFVRLDKDRHRMVMDDMILYDLWYKNTIGRIQQGGSGLIQINEF